MDSTGGGVESVVVGGGVGLDSVEVEVDVPLPLPPVAPSDMHQPPLSDIQWYPDGQEPLVLPPPEVEVVPVEEDELVPDERQVQAEESQ